MSDTWFNSSESQYARLLGGYLSLGDPTDSSERLAIKGTGVSSSGHSQERFSNNTFGPTIYTRKSRGAAINDQTIVQANDEMGKWVAYGSNGTVFKAGAGIYILCDSAPNPGDDYIPGEVRIATSPGGATALQYRAAFKEDGRVGIGTTSPDAKLEVAGDILTGAGTKCDGMMTTEASEVQNNNANPITVDSITLLDENTYHVEAWVIGVKSDGSARASYHIACTVYRTGGGGATLQGGISSLHTSESDPNWDATFTVNGNDLRVSATGVAATTIDWVCVIKYINMSN